LKIKNSGMERGRVMRTDQVFGPGGKLAKCLVFPKFTAMEDWEWR
jgi:hypothetical protein